MAIDKPSIRRRLRPVPVDVHFDEMGGQIPIGIHYPLFPMESEPEAHREYRKYKIQKVADVRTLADVDLGITGVQYTVDVFASQRKTVRTVLWFDDTKWYIEEKIKPTGGAP